HLSHSADREWANHRSVLFDLSDGSYKIQRYGRICLREPVWPSPVCAAHKPKENVGRIFRRARALLTGQLLALRADSEPPLGISPRHVIILGLLLGLGAIIGDLAESIIKRSAHA